MKIETTGTIKIETDFNPGANLKVKLEQGGNTSIDCWLSSKNKIGQIKFLEKCHEELGKIIEHLKTGKIYNERKWYQFWREK